VAVSPYVAGQVVKGPTDIFMQAVGRPSTAAGVASLYEGLIDGMVCDPDDPDPAPDGLRVLSCPTVMDGREGRRALAERTLEFASMLRTSGE
jgi:LPPG:FO 2-phospho-L-lactate transferase